MTDQEKQDFFKFEREIQKLLDEWYERRNHKIDRSRSCKQFDLIMDDKFKIEEKIRDCIRDDLLIEIVQDLVTKAPGWFTETECDYLHYVFTKDRKPIKIVRLNWPDFKVWFIEYLSINKFIQAQISTKGWGCTINLILPINCIDPSLRQILDIRPPMERP